MGGCLLGAPYWRPGPQPRHVPWQGIESSWLTNIQVTQGSPSISSLSDFSQFQSFKYYLYDNDLQIFTSSSDPTTKCIQPTAYGASPLNFPPKLATCFSSQRMKTLPFQLLKVKNLESSWSLPYFSQPTSNYIQNSSICSTFEIYLESGHFSLTLLITLVEQLFIIPHLDYCSHLLPPSPTGSLQSISNIAWIRLTF